MKVLKEGLVRLGRLDPEAWFGDLGGERLKAPIDSEGDRSLRLFGLIRFKREDEEASCSETCCLVRRASIESEVDVGAVDVVNPGVRLPRDDPVVETRLDPGAREEEGREEGGREPKAGAFVPATLGEAMASIGSWPWSLN